MAPDPNLSPSSPQSDVCSPPSDVCLLLRAHAEQRWLSNEVLPVLRELEQSDSLAEEQLGAALAYLEVIWIEASRRAAETDATFAELEAACAAPRRAHQDTAKALSAKARRYHASVRTLREAMGQHVSRLITTPTDAFTYDHAS
ncbi:MAG TPA: hypothetical protein VGG98_05115 [Solirubrobacteraceae bacterium]|jgi:hypothetical protein